MLQLSVEDLDFLMQCFAVLQSLQQYIC